MEVSEHIAALRVDGALMAAAIDAVGPDAAIPTCPEWTMRDLVLHQGEVHRWARTHVAEARTEPVGDDTEWLGPLPDDGALAAWFREGHAMLVDALETADPDVQCWSFLAAPSPLAFWARRQCHETGIHRADAQSASGAITPFPAAVAADGIDELLTGFVTRPKSRLRSETPTSLRVQADDTGDEWLVRVHDTVVTERNAGASADCTIRGAASDLHLFLWNRGIADPLAVDGDTSVLDLWRTSVTIRWS